MFKRGISPLIATVLLIGLTIVIAVLIIGFINGVFVEIIDEEPTENLCLSNIDIDYGNPCIYSGNLRVPIENTGNVEISKLVFMIFHDGVVDTYENSTGLGAYSSVNFYFLYNAGFNYEKLRIIPFFGNAEQECGAKEIQINSLSNCQGTSGPICGDGVINQGSEECDQGDIGNCIAHCLNSGLTFSQCDNLDLIDDDGIPFGCMCVCDTTPPMGVYNFDILGAEFESDFWYPIKMRIRNNGPLDIHGFNISVNGGSGNDQHLHRHTVFNGEVKEFYIFTSPEVGTINQITLTPGKKTITAGGSVQWEWDSLSEKNTNLVTGSRNWNNVLNYWTFKQDSDSDYEIFDNSPNDISCFVNSSDIPIWKNDKYCLLGRCYYLPGFNQGLQCENPAHYDSNVDYNITIETVVRPWRIMTGSEEQPEGTSTKHRMIASKYMEDIFTQRSWLLRLDNNTENLRFRIYRLNNAGTDDTYRTIDSDDPVFTVGAIWHHIVAQYAGDYARLYVDGVLVGENSWGSTREIIDSPGAPVMVGDWQNWGGDTFNGRIESIALYNSFLDETTVKKHASDLFKLADCPKEKKTNEPDYCFHLESYGINNGVNIANPGGGWYLDAGNYYGLKEYVEFSDPGNCDVAIMAVHGGSTEFGTEQMARYLYNQLSANGNDVGLWVYGSRNTDCSYCSPGCEDKCHHVTSSAIDPECDPFLREILTRCKIGIALHGCDSGCLASADTYGLPPVLIGGRAESELKTFIFNYSNSSLGNDYYFVNFDEVKDCKYYFDDVSCYRGVDHCNIVNQFYPYNSFGIPGIQLEMPPQLRSGTTTSFTSAQCNVPSPPAGCFDRFENENLVGDSLLAANSFISAIEDYITFKGW